MKAIFLRELRENVKWAAMICGLFSVLILLRAWHSGPFLLFDLAQDLTLVYAPIAGLAMGIAQSWFEVRADNWGFAVHRPVERARLFAAKCAAGLVLLYLSLSLPCLAVVAWAGVPGNLSMPLQSRMALPMLADVLCAGCYYFVGILLTLRQAHWLGTRVLPLGLAFVCSVAVRMAPQFWHAVAFVVVAEGIGAVAAWGAFSTAGAADRRGMPALGLGAMIYVGALTLGCFLVGFLAIFESTVQWRDLRMDRQGNLLQTTKTLQDGELSYLVADMTGRAVPEFEGVNLDDPAEADRFLRFTGALIDDRLLPWPISTIMARGYRSAAPGVVALRNIAPPDAKIESMALYDGSEHVIDLYDPATNVLIGQVGPSGFASGTEAKVDRFPGELLNHAVQGSTRTLAFSSGVFWMELDQRRVRKVFEAPADDPVVCAHELPPQKDPLIVVATRARLHLLRPSGEIIFAIPLDQDLTKYAIEAAFIPANHHLVLRAEAISPGLEDQFPPRFWEYAVNGALVRQNSAPVKNETDDVTMARTAAFGGIHPLLGLPFIPRWILDMVFGLDSQHHSRLFLLCSLAMSILSALTAILLGRNYELGSKAIAAWSLISLLLGPAAVVVMLGLNEWPARETCILCGGRRLAGRCECPRCAAPLPGPLMDGREIFEPAETLELAF